MGRRRPKNERQCPAWTGTHEHVTEMAGRYIRKQLDKVATVRDCVMIVMRKPGNVFSASVGSRVGLLTQIGEEDPTVAIRISEELLSNENQIPIYAMDLEDDSCGIEWLPPLPNAQGGLA